MNGQDTRDSQLERETLFVRKVAFENRTFAGLTPELRTVIQKLQRNLRFFRNMREDEALLFLRFSRSKTFDEGETLTCPAEGGDCLCLLVTGEIIFQANGGKPFQIEPGVVFGTISLARGATARAGKNALIFYINQDILKRNMPSLTAKYDMCPFGIRSKEGGHLCFDPAAGKFFQPQPELLRSFCKWENGFQPCPHYRSFKQANGTA